MEQKVLNAAVRLELKKGATGRLRRLGKIPAVLYGHSGTSPIAIDAREFAHEFKQISENTIINLQVGDKAYDVLVKDFQEDILKGRITHIDFYEIERGKLLRTNVPIHTIGTPMGVREGGILETMLYTIEVECFPKDIPANLEIDVTGLDIGGSIHVGDIKPPENVKFLVPEDYLVVSVIAPRSVEELIAGEEPEEGVAAEAEGEEPEADEVSGEDES